MRYFVIMGNSRVGSTWIQVSMHSLPEVFCTREIRWRMPYMNQAPPPVQTYIDSTTTSIKERLELGRRIAGKDKATVVGAKLKFDPYGFALPSAYADLGKILEPDVYVIFLRRSYFEIFQTWKAFGIRHLANPNAKKRERKKEDRQEKAGLNRFYTMHSVPLEQKQIFITRDGNVVARYLHNKYSGSSNLYCSIGDAIDDLLVLFYNDVMGLSVVERHANTDIFYYQDIRSKFFDVTQKLALPVTPKDCREALDNASTLQIEPPGIKLVFPDDALKEISDYLDRTFHRIRVGELGVGEVVRCDEQKGTVTFYLPALAAIFAKHQETQWLLRSEAPSRPHLLQRVFAPTGRVEGHYPRAVRVFRSLFTRKIPVQQESWVAQRPMFVPVAVAPAPTIPLAGNLAINRS